MIITILILVNSGYACSANTFNPRNWLITITAIYFVDFLLITAQKRYLLNNRRENACVTMLRFLVLVALVVFYIIGNVNYFGSSGVNDCGSLRTFAFIMLIFGYLEMLKCCCIGTVICCLIPIIFFTSRQAQRPNWMPAPPQFVQNLYHTRFRAPAQAGNEEFVCSICLLEYSENDEIIQLPCDERHFFHSGCITEWLNKNNNCPLCKAPITQDAL